MQPNPRLSVSWYLLCVSTLFYYCHAHNNVCSNENNKDRFDYVKDWKAVILNKTKVLAVVIVSATS